MYVGPILFGLLSIQCGAVEVQSSDCPDLTGPTTVTPGETAVVTGGDFLEGGCGGWSPGCASTPMPVPRKNIRIVLEQQDRSWELATVDADAAFVLEAELTVPADLAAGAAVLRADEAELNVTVQEPPP